MRSTEEPGLRCARAPRHRGGDRGAILLYVLLITALVGAVTASVMLLLVGDVSGGVRQLQAVRVFNIAEAGIHYALAKLQAAGASTYAGETVTISDGSTVLGTAAVSVACLDGQPLPCSGTYAAFRRIVSTGTLPVAGPRRILAVVVEGFPQGTSPYAICATDSVIVNQGITIYGDIVSNGMVSLLGPADNYSRVRADPPPPYSNNGYYSGSVRAAGAITCSVGCPTQVQGTTAANVPGPVCPAVALPAFAPGIASMTVTPSGWTMDGSTGYDWSEIVVQAAGTASGCTGSTPFADLRIHAGPAGTTTVVNVRRLTMGRCGRLMLLGEGTVELRLGEETAQALVVGQYGRFGMLPTDSLETPAPAPAGRLTVYARSSALDPAAVQIDRASVVAGTFMVPNGEWDEDRQVGAVGQMYGAVLARNVDIDRDFVFTYDPTATVGTPTYGSFTRLRSWKDQ